MKTKRLIAAAVALGNLAAVLVGAGGEMGLVRGGPFVRWLCDCLLVVAAFPLGWLAKVLARLLSSPGLYYSVLGTGVVLNAALWGLAVYGFLRTLERRVFREGFDAGALLPRIEELRHQHAAVAHSRAKPLHFRKELVAAAARVLAGLGYFSRASREHPESPPHEGAGHRE